MVELPKTEEELTSLIKSEVEKATKELVSKHNGEMASLRTKYDADIKKAKEQANLTAEELAAQKIKEQQVNLAAINKVIAEVQQKLERLQEIMNIRQKSVLQNRNTLYRSQVQ